LVLTAAVVVVCWTMGMLALMMVCHHTAWLLTAASRTRATPLAVLLLLVSVWMLPMLLGLLLLWMRVLGVRQWVLGMGMLLLLC
jgi:hypothetical protein